ncbi:alpha,alpha-trehalose-phosphate synthase (UDP-forming) [Asticcacaulis sp. EMRT-3]|uniref:alpha,alpha-trehalose-phosphate synthase (UDP-forming) n=1 Tax=Asticcacaulis sp. EMRT-3 TaxID=3040349 RepID=UPI0024AF7098|nr:alpha,alpha-trehalose-phosphate synthase (UDP-forming) [Asticcacaulis sp. EMRT-3]MDI7775300.1 alpha,alpha-trehalose-phosphate synthase (UDP-forming) [Asticcacaulis sp. EMRT-3]
MSRLIVVSNRVNPPADTGVGTSGGLAMALSAALREDKGLWFGWSGETVEQYTGQMSMQVVGGVTVALLDLEEQDREEYYNGYANRTLWPLFHYRTDLVNYERSFDEGYERVNTRFAETLLPLIGPDDIIWVQDYHLIPLGRELRKRGVKNRIGFFLHIPWPTRRVLNTLPRHAELVESMFSYDLIGFQTEDDAEAFNDYVIHDLEAEAFDNGIVRAGGQTTRVKAFPIGIDAADFAETLKSDKAEEFRKLMITSQAGRKMILGVDRLDYSKGLEERFSAYETLLDKYEDLHTQVFMLQIATRSRDAVDAYQDLRERLDTISGQINGAHATVDWVPLRYVNRPYRRDELAGIYASAHVGLVTPLRDGMNLVAKEYVASQPPEDPGVLVLSEFAGAAEQMKEALIVNPMSREDVAEAIRKGLSMPLKERKTRWELLMDKVQKSDVSRWRDDFVSLLKAPVVPERPRVVPMSMTPGAKIQSTVA